MVESTKQSPVVGAKPSPNIFSDWRNIALAVAVIVIILVLVLSGVASPSGSGKVVATVGNKTITEKDVVDELKRKGGDQVLMQMVNDAVIDSYATSKNIAVADAEIDQFVNFNKAHVEMGIKGMPMDKYLESKNMTMADFRKLVRTLIQQVKLIVPDDDIKAAAADPKITGELGLPTRYQFRFFEFSSEAIAKAAVDAMKKPDGLQNGIKQSLNPTTADELHTLAPEDMKMLPFGGTVMKLKAGEFSAPMASKQSPGVYDVVQLVAVLPAEKATYENCSIIIGQRLMSDQKYQGKVADLPSEALAKVDAQIISQDYAKAHQMLEETKKRNPVVHGADGSGGPAPMPNAPAAGGN